MYGFSLLPSRQLNVIVGDDVSIECKANKFFFSLPYLYHIDGLQETPLTSGQGLEVTRSK